MRKVLFFILIILSVNSYAISEDSSIESILAVDDYIGSVIELRNEKIENLLESLEKSDDDLEICKIANALCWIYFHSNPQKAMTYAKMQLAHLDKLNNVDAEIAAFDNMAFLYLGFSDNENAISYMLKTLKAKESINDAAGISVSFSGLAGVYLNMRNEKLALKYFEQAYENEINRNDTTLEGMRKMGVIMGNMGLCYAGMGNHDKGLEMYFKAVEIHVAAGMEFEATSSYLNIGLLYLNEKKNYDEALRYLKKAVEFLELTEDAASLSDAYSAISEVYSIKDNFAKALIYGKKAVKYANLGSGKAEVLNSNEILAKILYRNKNYQLAYDHFKVAFDMKDTIFNETSSEQIAEMQTKYDTEKKEAENSLLLAEKELDKVALDKKTTQQKMLIIGLFLALIIVVYIAYSLNQKKKTNKLLNTQNEIIEEKNRDITDSINYAQRIQHAVLPEESLLKNSFDSFIYYRPKDIVSGDFYWIKEVGDKLFFAVVDCTGHGVPGAFMSIIGANSLNKIIEDLKIETTGKILDELNNLVNTALGKKETTDDSIYIRDGMDISICCIDKKSNTIEYSGANNSLYFLRKSANKIEGLDTILENEESLFYEVKSNKMAIGGGINKENYTSHKFQLKKDDVVYLFSDGYADQFGGEKGKKFMYKPFKKMFLSIQNLSMDKQLSFLDETMEDWKGDLEQLDDICVMGVRI